jgi:hypothetical protein
MACTATHRNAKLSIEFRSYSCNSSDCPVVTASKLTMHDLRIDTWQCVILQITKDHVLRPDPLLNTVCLAAATPLLPAKKDIQKYKVPQTYADEARHTRPNDEKKPFLSRPLLFDIRLRMRRQKYK